MVAHLDHFGGHAPGLENAWLMLSAPQIGVRHTRRLVGRHKPTSEDWKGATTTTTRSASQPHRRP